MERALGILESSPFGAPLPSRSLGHSPILSTIIAPVAWLHGGIRCLWLTRAALLALLGTSHNVHCRGALGCIILLATVLLDSVALKLFYHLFNEKTYSNIWNCVHGELKRKTLGISRWRDSLKATKAENLAAHFGENVTKFQGKASSRLSIPLNLNTPRRTYILSSSSGRQHNHVDTIPSRSLESQERGKPSYDHIVCA